MKVTSKYALGIETSCDDTSVAVVDRDGQVLSSVVAKQEELHTKFGGVFPEMASRAHSVAIIPTISEAISAASIDVRDLCAISVTRGPGLIGSLVGINSAAGLGMAWGLPVIGVNHLRGHLRSASLEGASVKYPATVLLVSGGHTFIARMEDAWNITLLGETRDDSVGEAYDKVARMLGLGFPGGPPVDRLAKSGRASLAFPRPLLNEGLEFSFSGLKSSVARHIETSQEIVAADVAASFVDACLEILVAKCRRALLAASSSSLVVVGGVAASPQLRDRVGALCLELGVELRLPPLRWATDNGAMIAMAGWDYLERGIRPDLLPVVRLPIGEP